MWVLGKFHFFPDELFYGERNFIDILPDVLHPVKYLEPHINFCKYLSFNIIYEIVYRIRHYKFTLFLLHKQIYILSFKD